MSHWLNTILLSISVDDWVFIFVVMASNILMARFGIWPYSLVTFPGTFAHELMHYLVALFFYASPCFPNLYPKRNGNTWTMGSVTFIPSLFNAIPIALAPFLLLPVGILLACYVMHPSTGWCYVVYGWVVGNVLFACLPSRHDWKIAIPSILMIGLLVAV